MNADEKLAALQLLTALYEAAQAGDLKADAFLETFRLWIAYEACNT
jgi:hypothetical protein